MTTESSAAPRDVVLRVDGLSKRYGQFAAIKNVSFAVHKSTVHAFIGPNGAGKTTLFHCITGILRPTSGSITLNGSEITHLQANLRSRMGLGRSFQITSIFPALSVFENVRLAAQARSWLRAFDFLSDVSRLHKSSSKTEELLVKLNLQGSSGDIAGTLSHGQQRRLEVAMALAGDPSILLLDEPTAGMGVDDIEHMAQLIRSLAAEITVVLVEHNIPLILSVSDVVTVMNYGEVLTQGPPSMVTADEKVRERYLGAA
ncbi:ABC transporter ATP-binding protein [Bradyrhizobium sp. 149]|uniref:ABC transporter ATP-binding protein n=1 Tax=Bradyrhizobium sp. 149 TaxID=2782624 RepID=UPI001FF8468D|nr:ABC transporter ATP-binding protein [Bradyrhizobium sp. 149]MCK1655333.1 ABC transporter ATP-binding protein [Bradyrhizobium sp. 149]